ncbi:MAG TPA: CSLREA domain-containing protein, partial [Ardenticatenaceae bacterium]
NGTGNRIQRNAIHDNGQQGIDLGSNGPTDNDTNDPDSGANNLQNYPTFTALINLSGQLVVSYAVDSSTSNSTYPLTVEFFEADSAASGEGKTFLGDNSYNQTPGTPKSVTLGSATTLGVADGDPIVATATDANGNTSEFSLSVAVDVEQPGPTFTVNSANDSNDGFCTEFHCSLREAINAANARTNTNNDATSGADPDHIHFDIPGSGVQTITPGSGIPTILAPVVIDGTTQSDASCASWPPTLRVEVSGSRLAGGSNLLYILTSNSTVRGLALNGTVLYGSAIQVSGASNRIECNFIGLNAAGTGPTVSSTGVGVRILRSHGTNNVIGTNGDGTADATERNLISGNLYGVWLEGDTTHVAGNTIGTNAAGTSALPNTVGVVIDGTSSSNIIGTNGDGTADAAERNLISGNSSNGVMISGIGSSNNNRVAGNTIGTNAAGTSALPNDVGVLVEGSASSNIIGTNSSDTDPAQTGDEAEGNLISGNTNAGVWLIDSDTNRVAGNRIGTNADGTGALANSYGVLIQGGASSNIIGTDGDGTADEAERNLISGNTEGVWITGASSDDNRVAGNYIGTNPAGTGALPNNTGLLIELGASDTIIRTNLISGNGNYGVLITGADTDDNWLAGNTIGTNAAGTSALPNSTGVVIQNGASNNLIGTDSDGTADEAEDNLISGNSDTGIRIAGSDTDNNRVAGNSIGTDAAGTSALANVTGVYVGSDANSNIIGTNGDGTGDNGEGNLISGNTDGGIHLSGTISTTVAGNVVGLDVTGAVLSNTVGILVADTMSSTIGTNGDGTSDEFEGNVISGNGSYGVQLAGGSEGNTIAGNLIGVVQATVTPAFRARGSLNAGTPSAVTPVSYDPRGNGGDGIFISAEGDPSTNNLIGGNLPVEQNVIANNGSDGVAIVVGTGNRVQRNAMFNNSEQGIDLGDNGLTPNDPGDFDGSPPPDALGDTDDSPNHLQNYPTMDTAIINSSGELVVTYFVDSFDSAGSPLPVTASTYPLTIEFFEADSATSGEGQTFLAEDTYTMTLALKTYNLGSAAALNVAVGDPLVGTATDAEGNTSEFSVPVTVAAPAAVQLAGFTATLEGEQVLLQWETVSEQGNAGFHLYRSTSPDSEGERLNAALIASEAPNSSEGFAYQWVDNDVDVGTTYYYWLEAVDLDGATSRYGPTSASVQVPTSITLSTFSTISTVRQWWLVASALTLVAGALYLRRR